MNDLQQIIENKTKVKLQKEVQEFINFLNGSNLFKAIQDFEITNEKGDKITLNKFFWNPYETGGKIITEKLLPSYIKAESKAFVEKVEQLSVEIDELKNF